MDHTRLLATLSDDQRADLMERKNAPALLRIGTIVTALALSGVGILLGVPGWPFVLVVHGILLIFLFTLMHEASHETAFASPRLNQWAARMCGVLVLVPPLWFRYFHLAHHRHTQDPDRDPELEGGKPQTRWQYVRHISGIPLWWSMIKTVTRNACGEASYDYVPQKARARVVTEARMMLALYAAIAGLSIALSSTALFWLWLLPALIGQPFLRLYLLAEHGRCPLVSNMLENSRTTLTNRFVRYIAWNMPFHAEHHALPTVPFHKLPKLHQIAQSQLRTVSGGYAQFHCDYVMGLEQSEPSADR